MLLEWVAARARSLGIEQLTTICPASSHTLIRLLSNWERQPSGGQPPGLLGVRVDLGGAPPDRCIPPDACQRLAARPRGACQTVVIAAFLFRSSPDPGLLR